MIQFPRRMAFRAEFFDIFNHPNFGKPQQHPEQPPVRPLDANAGEQPGLWRRKWRLQPPLPNRRRPSIQLALKLQF